MNNSDQTVTSVGNNISSQNPISILLADDDRDDRFFFNDALSEISIPTELTTVEDGEELMRYLSKNTDNLPHVLFLDLNMPRKNGSECLAEMKLKPELQKLPVIIYSTSLNEEAADELYKNGAYYYIRKTDSTELKKILQHILTMLSKNMTIDKSEEFVRPSRDKFVLSLMEV